MRAWMPGSTGPSGSGSPGRSTATSAAGAGRGGDLVGDRQETQPAALDALYARTGRPGRDRRATCSRPRTMPSPWPACAKPPDFHIFLPPDWRDRPDVTSALTWRVDAARRAGLTDELERLRYEWAPAAGVPSPGRTADLPPRAGRRGLRRAVPPGTGGDARRDLAEGGRGGRGPYAGEPGCRVLP